MGRLSHPLHLFCALSPGSPCSLTSPLDFQAPKSRFFPTTLSNTVTSEGPPHLP